MSYNFDPVTGQPINPDNNVNPGQNVTPGSNVNPKQNVTPGQPVYQQSVYQAPYQQTPYTQQPYGYPPAPGQPPKSNKGLVIGIVSAVVVCVLAIGALAAYLLIFGKNGRYIRAIEKSMDAGKLADTLTIDPYSDVGVTTGISYDDISLNLQFGSNNSAEEYSIQGTLDYGTKSISATAYMDNENLIISVPDVFDQNLLYNYREDKSGYIADEEIDMALQALNSSHSSRKVASDLYKAFKKGFNKLKFKRNGSKELIVDAGKNTRKKCTCYRAEITSEALLAAAYEAKDILENSDTDYSEVLDELDEVIEYLEEDYDDDYEDEDDKLYLDLYLYKGRVAYADMTEGDFEWFSVQFKGGNYWMENMAINVDGEELVITGDDEDRVETRHVKYDGQDLFSYKYDYGKDTITVSVAGDMAKVKGDLKKTSKGFRYTLTDVDIPSLGDVGSIVDSIDVYVEVGNERGITELNSKGALDVGNMSSDEVNDLFYDAESRLYDILSDFEDLADMLYYLY